MQPSAARAHKGFTLIELMIVIVIIGVLATLGMIQLSGPKEQSLAKEAKANLKLIAAAEKIYRMETGSYVAAGDEDTINQVLRLMLPKGSKKSWQYTVTSPSAGEFTATATRTEGPKSGSSYVINETLEDPE